MHSPRFLQKTDLYRKHLANFYINFTIAVRRRWFVDRTSSNDGLENLVISTGGVATTFLMIYLSSFIKLNSAGDDDGCKHLSRLPPDYTGKILFIYGDEDDIFRSIERRGWIRYHGAKLGCVACLLTRGKLQAFFFKRAVRRQIRHFERCISNDLMLVRYDKIWDQKKEIAKFFNITDQCFIESFPARRSRSKKNDDQSLFV